VKRGSVGEVWGYPWYFLTEWELLGWRRKQGRDIYHWRLMEISKPLAIDKKKAAIKATFCNQ